MKSTRKNNKHNNGGRYGKYGEKKRIESFKISRKIKK